MKVHKGDLGKEKQREWKVIGQAGMDASIPACLYPFALLTSFSCTALANNQLNGRGLELCPWVLQLDNGSCSQCACMCDLCGWAWRVFDCFVNIQLPTLLQTQEWNYMNINSSQAAGIKTFSTTNGKHIWDKFCLKMLKTRTGHFSKDRLALLTIMPCNPINNFLLSFVWLRFTVKEVSEFRWR